MAEGEGTGSASSAGSWFSPDQLKRMQEEFGLSPLATELIGQAPAMIQKLKGSGMGMGMMGGGALMGMLGGGGGKKKEGPSTKDLLLQSILSNLGGTPAAPPSFAPAPTTPMTPAVPETLPPADTLGPSPPPLGPPAGAPATPPALQPPGLDPLEAELARQRQGLLRRPQPGEDLLARYLGAV